LVAGDAAPAAVAARVVTVAAAVPVTVPMAAVPAMAPTTTPTIAPVQEPALSAPVPLPTAEPEPFALAAAAAATPQSEFFDGDWPALARTLALTGIARQCVDRSALVSFDEHGIVLRAPIRAMTDAVIVAKVRDALASHFGRPLRLTILSGEIAGPTVAGIDSAQAAQRLAQAQSAIDTDPIVQSLLEGFGGHIVPGSVQPSAD
jgi:DNA polymerase-3 subunit gamma/tau